MFAVAARELMYFKKDKKDIFSGLQKKLFFHYCCFQKFLPIAFQCCIMGLTNKIYKMLLYYFMSSVAARWFILILKSHLVQCSHI